MYSPLTWRFCCDRRTTAAVLPTADRHRHRTVAGYEALARLRRDDGEVVSAGPLFSDPEVDQTELLHLDRDVRRMALEHFQVTPTGFIALNISPKWLTQISLEAPLPS